MSVEEVSNIMRRLTLVIPRDQVEDTYKKQIRRFAEEADIKGFRRGKVPVSYIEQRYGEKVRREALEDVVQNAFNQVISEKNLQPVSQPQVEPKVTGPEEPLEFIVSFEVLPEIEKVNFSLDHVDKPIVDISSSDVDDAIVQLLKRYAKWNIVDRPAKEKDRVVITYHPIYEGQANLDEKVIDYSLELGSHMMISGFEEGLIGAKAGDVVTLKLQFPDDYEIEEKASKPVDFEIEVKHVYEAEIPSSDAQFVKSLGVKSGLEEDMKKQIKETLEYNRDRLVREKLKEQVFTILLEQNSLEVPQALIERVSKNIHDEIYQHREHHHEEHSEEELTTYRDIAKKRVTVGLLISAFAKHANLKIDKDLVKARIKEIASSYENPAEVAKWLLTKERIGDIESQVLEDQVLDKLLESISVTEKPMSYNELIGKNV
jgi:trigger factor